MNLLLQFVTCTIRTFLAKFTLLNSVDGDITSNKSESSTARATIVKKIIIFISNVCCTPTLHWKRLKEEGGVEGRAGLLSISPLSSPTWAPFQDLLLKYASSTLMKRSLTSKWTKCFQLLYCSPDVFNGSKINSDQEPIKAKSTQSPYFLSERSIFPW